MAGTFLDIFNIASPQFLLGLILIALLCIIALFATGKDRNLQ